MTKNKKNKTEKNDKREVPAGFGGGAARKDKDLVLFIGKKKVVFEHYTSATSITNPKPLEPDHTIRVTQKINGEKIQTIVNLNNFTHWVTREHKTTKKVKK